MTEIPRECEKCSYSMNIRLFGKCPFDKDRNKECPRFIKKVRQ